MKSLRKLLPYVKPYMLFAILAPILMCIEVAMDLLSPTIMQHIIDVGIANDDTAYVIKLGIVNACNCCDWVDWWSRVYDI